MRRYVLADTYDKTQKGWAQALGHLEEKQPDVPLAERRAFALLLTTAKAVDTLTWQMVR